MISSSLVMLLAMIVVVGPLILGFAIIAAVVGFTFVGALYALFREFIRDVFDETKLRQKQTSTSRKSVVA